MPDLMVNLDGRTVPLADCHWVLFDADGCAEGSLFGRCAVDEEQAHQELRPLKRDRDREARRGYQVRLLTREQWRRDAKPCLLGRCEHRKGGAA
ncbi:hypothetical protein [Streptomyces rimosus]|uniref:hypothetical protein n=1 Tax=Streptomyces rimosus TaxID=1927 RepID=UPI00131E8215|nr:hypothetical protein [Streptomyces rimosus]